MQVNFTSGSAEAQALVTDQRDIGPDRWRHAEVTGTASSETEARALAQEIKELLAGGRDVNWRVPFEYKTCTRLTHGGRIEGWRLYGRFSFR